MEKQIFKVGDKVFDIFYGWGEVKEIQEEGIHVIRVDFDNYSTNYTKDGKDYHTHLSPILSFTEYDLVNGGFSQERPINYSNYIGKYCKFWNKDKHNTVIDRFVSYDNSKTKFFESTFDYYENFEPLTEEQIEILNLK